MADRTDHAASASYVSQEHARSSAESTLSILRPLRGACAAALERRYAGIATATANAELLSSLRGFQESTLDAVSLLRKELADALAKVAAGSPACAVDSPRVPTPPSFFVPEQTATAATFEDVGVAIIDAQVQAAPTPAEERSITVEGVLSIGGGPTDGASQPHFASPSQKGVRTKMKSPAVGPSDVAHADEEITALECTRAPASASTQQSQLPLKRLRRSGTAPKRAKLAKRNDSDSERQHLEVHVIGNSAMSDAALDEGPAADEPLAKAAVSRSRDEAAILSQACAAVDGKSLARTPMTRRRYEAEVLSQASEVVLSRARSSDGPPPRQSSDVTPRALGSGRMLQALRPDDDDEEICDAAGFRAVSRWRPTDEASPPRKRAAAFTHLEAHDAMTDILSADTEVVFGRKPPPFRAPLQRTGAVPRKPTPLPRVHGPRRMPRAQAGLPPQEPSFRPFMQRAVQVPGETLGLREALMGGDFPHFSSAAGPTIPRATDASRKRAHRGVVIDGIPPIHETLLRAAAAADANAAIPAPVPPHPLQAVAPDSIDEPALTSPISLNAPKEMVSATAPAPLSRSALWRGAPAAAHLSDFVDGADEEVWENNATPVNQDEEAAYDIIFSQDPILLPWAPSRDLEVASEQELFVADPDGE